MDTKSLAKSKRAHSQHHKKHHSNQKAKAATTTTTTSVGGASSSTNNKAARGGNTVVTQQPRQSHGSSALPSNWDRYEEEEDVDNPITTESQKTDGQSGPQKNDIIVLQPKSKGADYAYLISEAKSQNSTRLSSSDIIFPSLEDFVSDIGEGKVVGVRGESLVSSIQNDTFFVAAAEDDNKTPPATSYEAAASFLSLNLHALSEQLAKIDLPKRLFMEADLFLFPPSDTYSERGEKESENRSHDHDKITNKNELKPYNHHQEEPAPSKPTTSHQQNPVHDNISTNPTAPNLLLVAKSPSESEKNKSKSKFEPPPKTTTAQLQLDMLLDSFADDTATHLKEGNHVSKSMKEEKTVGAFDIDDLLKETTSTPTPTPLGINVSSSSSQQPLSKSQLLDDFDSWLDTI